MDSQYYILDRALDADVLVERADASGKRAAASAKGEQISLWS